MNYTYKGTNINNLIVSGSSSLTGYGGFPTYKSASTYSSERPLPFGISLENISVSNLMDASYIDLTSGTATLTVPSDYNSFRAVLEGGGGGGGAGSSCGINDAPGPGGDRNPSGNGGNGSNGGFAFVSYTPLTQRSIQYFVGNGGAGGDGAGANSPGSYQNGNTDQNTGQATGTGQSGQNGNTSYITFTTSNGTFTVTANAGTGGNAAGGGDGGTPAVTQTTINYQQSELFSRDGNQQTATIPAAVNPILYLQNYSSRGTGSGESRGGNKTSPGTAGKPGFIRIYLLKD
jgi:hypothetical protein